jgi:hypothetical protein
VVAVAALAEARLVPSSTPHSETTDTRRRRRDGGLLAMLVLFTVLIPFPRPSVAIGGTGGRDKAFP